MSDKSLNLTWIILIILLSFRLFATIFYPMVNSDEGIIVLMLHYFELPDTLYFWGQDRYGAIVPLLGQIPHKLFGLSSPLSESITHYAIMIAGFFAFSAFIKEKKNRILLALVWFFPAIYYTDFIKNIFGLQYSLTGLLLFTILIYEKKFGDNQKPFGAKVPYLLLMLILFIAAFWVSDLSITVTIAYILTTGIFIIKDKRLNAVIKKPETYFLLFSLIVSFLVIRKLKSICPPGPYDHYSDSLINSFPGIIEALRMLSTTIINILLFRIPDFLYSIYAWLVITLPVLMIVNRKKIRIDPEERKWILFLLLNIIILTGIIITSEWAQANAMPRRYFIGVYISSWILYFIIMGAFTPGRAKNIVLIITVITVLTGSLSTVYHIRYLGAGSFKPKAVLAMEFAKEGKTGIIAEYWNSYSNSFADPELIKATPYELSYAVRNFSLVDSVFAQPRILLVGDMWLEEFPDRMRQFDRDLQRKGEPFTLGGCRVCEYAIQREWTFPIDSLHSLPGHTVYDEQSGREVFKVGEDYEACIYKHIVFGPFMTLLKGRYEVSFSIRFDSLLTQGGDIAEIDVASDYGNVKHASLMLKPALIPGTGEYHDYRLEFDLTEKNTTLEFRIYYLGGAMLTFDHITVRQLGD